MTTAISRRKDSAENDRIVSDQEDECDDLLKKEGSSANPPVVTDLQEALELAGGFG